MEKPFKFDLRHFKRVIPCREQLFYIQNLFDYPVDPIPASLVATWWYSSATVNGSAVSSFSEISHDDLAVTSSITFGANGTWSSAEYDQGQNVVFTQCGTFTVSGNNLNITRTLYDGTPENETYTMMWAVAADTLTLTAQETVDSQTIIMIVVYSK